MAERVGGAVLAAQPLESLHGFAMPLLDGGEVPLLLGDDPQLVIGGGGAGLVALFLIDRQRLAIPLLGGGHRVTAERAEDGVAAQREAALPRGSRLMRDRASS